MTKCIHNFENWVYFTAKHSTHSLSLTELKLQLFKMPWVVKPTALHQTASFFLPCQTWPPRSSSSQSPPLSISKKENSPCKTRPKKGLKIVIKCAKRTFSSSFFTVFRLALKSTDSFTLAPSRAPSMASAEIFTLLRAGRFILPFNSKIFMDKFSIWQESNTGFKSFAVEMDFQIIVDKTIVLIVKYINSLTLRTIPPCYFWTLWLQYRSAPHPQHQS